MSHTLRASRDAITGALPPPSSGRRPSRRSDQLREELLPPPLSLPEGGRVVWPCVVPGSQRVGRRGLRASSRIMRDASGHLSNSVSCRLARLLSMSRHRRPASAAGPPSAGLRSCPRREIPLEVRPAHCRRCEIAEVVSRENTAPQTDHCEHTRAQYGIRPAPAHPRKSGKPSSISCGGIPYGRSKNPGFLCGEITCFSR